MSQTVSSFDSITGVSQTRGEGNDGDDVGVF